MTKTILALIDLAAYIVWWCVVMFIAGLAVNEVVKFLNN